MKTGRSVMMRVEGCILGSMLLFLAITSPSVAQDALPNIPGLGDRAQNTAANQEHARLLGMLVYTNVSVDFDKTPIREAMKALRQQLAVQVIGRYSDDAVGQGIDPETLISLEASNRPALEVLEEMLKQCDGLEECTWQLRRGFVEIGTKARLSVPAARDTRLYDISDMLIEPPSFSPKDDALASAFQRQFAGGGGGRPNDPGTIRKSPLAIAVGVVEEVVETIEPGHWDYGQPVQHDPDPSTERAEPKAVDGERNAPDRPAGSPPTKTTPAAAQSPPSAPVAASASPNDPSKAWARIRVWRQHLIVVAPDFIHRQIGGYPKAIKPDGAQAAEPASTEPPTR